MSCSYHNVYNRFFTICEKEGLEKKLWSAIQFPQQRHLTTFGSVFSESADLWELFASQNAKSFFSRKREKTLGTFNNILKLNP